MSLLLFAVVLFSQCSKSPNDEIIDSSFEKSEIETIAATSALSGTQVVSGTLDVSKATKVNGYAYVLYQNLNTPGDNSSSQKRSLIRIFENGVEIGPAHAKHSDIQTSGEGRFSHWNSELYFSASDNSNPRSNGRTYTFTTESGAVTAAPSTPTESPIAPSTPTSTDEPMGYATVDGMTTGGQGGQTVTVSSLSALSTALSSYSPMIIYVSGTITGTGSVNARSNKTIIGLSGATLNGVGIRIYGMSNIIIRNLKIQNVVAGDDDNDAINIKYSHHIWIDHCELSADRTHGWEYWDGLLDITRESNYITVSWTKFRDSHIATLVGGGIAGHESDRGKLKITYHHNYFYNLSERAPDMKYGTLHMFNNYHLNNSGYSVAAQVGGTVRTDNNYFSNCSKPITTTINGAEPGYVSGANTNTYVNSGKPIITTSESTWVPPYEYKSVMHATADVPSVVTSGAGPK